MLSLLLCVIAFFATRTAVRRSLGLGLIALLVVGYFYGIIRANLENTFSHFIFDAGLIGFYFGFPWKIRGTVERLRTAGLRSWATTLMGWPFVVVLMPFQPLLVSLVGLRGCILFLPMMLAGCRATGLEIKKIAIGLACLNLVAVGFGIAEFQLGVRRFFPFSPVTLIIYMSQDGAGRLRIPSTFSSAHAFAGAMLITLPLLLGAWMQSDSSFKMKLLMILGIMSAMGGIILASTRLNFVLGALVIAFVLLTSRMGAKNRVIWIVLLLVAGSIITGNSRFSRYKELDTDTVTDRVGGSVNRSFLEIMSQYPFGNGLGGGGTNMPYFLQSMIRNPVAIENEYGHIMLEQGVIGLALWLGFIGWFLTRRTAFAPSRWKPARRVYFFLQLVSFISASIGVGSFSSIPTTAVSLFMLGWISTSPVDDEPVAAVPPPVFTHRTRTLPSVYAENALG